MRRPRAHRDSVRRTGLAWREEQVATWPCSRPHPLQTPGPHLSSWLDSGVLGEPLAQGAVPGGAVNYLLTLLLGGISRLG